MKIMDYIIPKGHQNNDFIISLFNQFEKNGKLSEKQISSLRSVIDIEEDFFEYDFKCPDVNFQNEFNDLKAKLTRNRFKYTITKNRCIKAIQSILYNKPDWNLIDSALGHINQYRSY